MCDGVRSRSSSEEKRGVRMVTNDGTIDARAARGGSSLKADACIIVLMLAMGIPLSLFSL